MARYSLFVLKVSLDTNQPTNQPTVLNDQQYIMLIDVCAWRDVDAVKQKVPMIEPCVTVPPPVTAPLPPAASVSVTTKSPDAVPAPAAVELSVLGEDRVEPVTGIRKAMVKVMKRAQQVPHFGYADEVVVCRYD